MSTQPTSAGGPAEPRLDAVIVGGGITGLSAAWYLERAAEKSGRPVRYQLLEAGDRWGGKILTERTLGENGQPLVMEFGPDALLTRKPWALELAHELGLKDRILATNRDHPRTFVLQHGRPTPLPDGLNLLVPGKMWPFLRSPLFSAAGKVRLLLDLVLPARKEPGDETLASFVTRRLGREALDKLAEPLLGGVFNGEPDRQSMLATFPQFPAMERKYRSLILGSRAVKTQPSNDLSPVFISFKSGMSELVERLTERLIGDLRLGQSAAGIDRLDDGSYRVTLASGESLQAASVILAIPAPAAAALLKHAAPQAAGRLADMRTAGVGSAYLVYDRQQVPHPLDGYGTVIPASEGRQIDGMTWTSTKWKLRAPDGTALIRVFFGGPYTRQMNDKPDDELLAIVRAELQQILGVEAEPRVHRIHRWADGYPQYDLGHLERVAAIEGALPAGLLVTGSSYHGVGVPDCVRQGRDSAHAIQALLATKPVAASAAGM